MSGRKKHRNNGIVQYTRSDVLIRTRQGKPKIEYDKAFADELLINSINRSGLAHMPPKGMCYDCDKVIPPMRKLCGSCLAKREASPR